ncbi:MAG: DUF1573 domain-containing protein [Pirellulales bacterium]
MLTVVSARNCFDESGGAMRSSLFAAALALIAAGVMCLAQAVLFSDAADSGPFRLQITPAVFHLGSSHRSEPVTVVFKATNKAAEEILLVDVVTSCSCAKAEISHCILPPGESAKVVLEIISPEGKNIVSQLLYRTARDERLFYVALNVTGVQD